MEEAPIVIRAAQYVRMSTDHQQYSTDNQSDLIKAYAESHGIQVVRTYADSGKSGLNLAGRPSLQRLMRDVESGKADFNAILVYDVSRWGRFQDADEAGHLEHKCKRAGIHVHYCAEQFQNDGSIASNIIKALKRAMAAEHSRELSSKVFEGQTRLIRLGYRQGGTAGYGLRRMRVDEHGEEQGQLEKGQHKSLQTDRVILVPGPDDEIAVVERIYQLFVNDGKLEKEIAELLNDDGITNEDGGPWTRGRIHQILTNEKYIGNNVFNRVSFKLKEERVRNPPEDWIRCDAAFEPIVDVELFYTARGMIQERSRKLSDDQLLDSLRNLYGAKGKLSGILIDEAEGMPSSSAYSSRFGSLVRAYQLVGYDSGRDYEFLEINRRLRQMHPKVVDEVIEALRGQGAEVSFDENTGVMLINHLFSASIVLARCRKLPSGTYRWHIRLDHEHQPDITIAVRMDSANAGRLDYYLLPSIDMDAARLRLKDANGIYLDTYRFDTLDYFLGMGAQVAA